MNKATAKRIKEIRDKMTEYEVELTAIMDAEEAIFDGRSEKWQEGEAGEKNERDRSSLEDAISGIESVTSYLDDIDEVSSID